MSTSGTSVHRAKRAHFDALSERWDMIRPPEQLADAVTAGLARVEPLEGKVVVDVGCGTGLIERHLLPRIGNGRILALDFAPAMIERARARHPDPRVEWLCRDVLEAGIEIGSVDVVLCFNAFPHFPDPEAALAAMALWLRPQGHFLLWHDVGREELAAIHGQAGPLLSTDVLPPVTTLTAWCERAGLTVHLAEEAQHSYTLLARRAERG